MLRAQIKATERVETDMRIAARKVAAAERKVAVDTGKALRLAEKLERQARTASMVPIDPGLE